MGLNDFAENCKSLVEGNNEEKEEKEEKDKNLPQLAEDKLKRIEAIIRE